MTVHEVNFDGLVGPTHNYAGLAFGNVAATAHEGDVSSPRQAALQGLEKMWALCCMGLHQGVLPPHERPYMPALGQLGFHGSEAEMLEQAARQAPEILAAVCSASTMWVANAATVSPFPDTEDGKTHITPANLSSMFHRAIEPDTTARVLRAIFSGDDYRHHPPLPAGSHFADEGAANHTRFCGGGGDGIDGSAENANRKRGGAADGGGDKRGYGYGAPGVELFVYGVSVLRPFNAPRRYPARQTLEASTAIARRHGLAPARTVFAHQNPAAIDAGVFHNDVIAVGNRDVLLYHEQAFADPEALHAQLKAAYDACNASPAAGKTGKGTAPAADGGAIHFIEVPSSAVSLEDAVTSYLFNSQLVCLPDGNSRKAGGNDANGGDSSSTIIAPIECEELAPVRRHLEEAVAAHPRIAGIRYMDLRQSMNNGGGPACLRLRVVMSEAQIKAVRPRVMLDKPLYTELRSWIEHHYRDRLTPTDLRDPSLLQESRTALDALTQILKTAPLYDFQRN